MKIAFTDVETSGLNPSLHEIVSIGCVIFDHNTFEISDQFEFKTHINHPEQGSNEAFRVNGYNEKEWKDAVSLDIAMMEYRYRTKDCMFAAHNVVFDYSFIKEAFNRCGMAMTFSRHKIDLFTLAWAKIPSSAMEKWSLKAICEKIGIEPEPEVHTALNGAMKGYEVYKKLMS